MSGETQTNVPRRLGRYDVLRCLETTPRWSLFVGRLDEPGTSRRLVTIQRIEPSLIRGRDLDVFLTKARTAPVEHGNLIEIEEVTHADGEVFVVMEHLAGETAAALVQRLVELDVTVDYGVAAYVVAEAAAAVDAVHSTGTLHDHLTPRDLFICYDGQVKIIPPQIAAALEQFETPGTVSDAELPFASPERCKGEPSDRRGDVFSLGAILWLLMTSVSPFERLSEADTIRAILTEDPLFPPKFVREVPTQLSEIALRAVSRDRAKRYATARALRHELRTFLRGLPIGASPAATLAERMRKWFAQRVQQQTELIEKVASPSDAPASFVPTRPPPPQEETAVERPTIEVAPGITFPASEVAVGAAPETTSNASSPEAFSSVDEPPALTFIEPRRRAIVPTAIAGVFVVGGLLFFLFGRGASSPPLANAGSSPSGAVSSAILASSSGVALPVAPASGAPSVSASGEASEARTTVNIDTVPPKSTVVLDGNVVGVTPIELKLPKRREPVTVELRHPGYQNLKEQVVPDVDQRLRLTLNLAPRTTPAASSTGNPYHRFD